MGTSGDGKELKLRLDAREEIADGVTQLTFVDPDGSELPAWEPGAHIDIAVDAGVVRQYSLCGDPEDRSSMQVAVLREAEGRGGSVRICDEFASGDLVRTGGPRNNFALKEADRYVFIAGGIGITPILPMVRRIAATNANWALVYGGRTRDSMAFRSELTSEYGENVYIRPQDEYGLLDLASWLERPRDDTLVYCCGPEPLLTAVEQLCAGWPSKALQVERFAPKDLAQNEGDVGFEVELARSGQSVRVEAGRSIVDAVADVGVEVPTSCREGTCGTCETRVLDGLPDHRDSLLTEEERAENNSMMVCVSRCRSTRLVLDL